MKTKPTDTQTLLQESLALVQRIKKSGRVTYGIARLGQHYQPTLECEPVDRLARKLQEACAAHAPTTNPLPMNTDLVDQPPVK